MEKKKKKQTGVKTADCWVMSAIRVPSDCSHAITAVLKLNPEKIAAGAAAFLNHHPNVE